VAGQVASRLAGWFRYGDVVTAPPDPVQRFAALFERAKEVIEINPEAMVVATAGADGRPSARFVLLKHFDERGFVFYTNLQSRKGRELHENPRVALCFYWPPLGVQVRVEGPVERVGDAEADAYFGTRDRASQIGAWASPQSEALVSRDDLEARVAEIDARFRGRDVPRPPHWTGLRVVPDRIEFWTSRESRLHERVVYERRGREWVVGLLAP
jgi:pyridoxamine 5'-phosphate oxidase